MVRLHEVYEDAEHAYIIMENCKGGDLETMLEVFISPQTLSVAMMSSLARMPWMAIV